MRVRRERVVNASVCVALPHTQKKIGLAQSVRTGLTTGTVGENPFCRAPSHHHPLSRTGVVCEGATSPREILLHALHPLPKFRELSKIRREGAGGKTPSGKFGRGKR